MQRFTKELRRRRSALLARYYGALERVDAELAETDAEETERATEQWDAQLVSRASDEDVRALSDIVAALRRIADGSYGFCEDCGDWIGDARLEAVPATTTCIGCAQVAERHAVAPPPFKRAAGS
jgi:DnaK suppressor protein